MMRLLGAIGILALGALDVVVLFAAVRDLHWKGIALMLFLAVLLTFFARTLWRGWRIERGAEQGRLAEGPEGEPLTTFVTSVMAKSVEGRIYIAGTLASELMAVLIWFMPAAVAISPDRSHALALLFAFWPVIAFVLYVRVAALRTSRALLACSLRWVSFPFPSTRRTAGEIHVPQRRALNFVRSLRSFASVTGHSSVKAQRRDRK